MRSNRLTQRRLKELYRYNAVTGVFTRLINTKGHLAGPSTSKTIEGYIRIKIDGTTYFAHRLAFLWMIGRWPHKCVDHANLQKDDNSWGNLREATYTQNRANTHANSNNKCGLKGVSWHKRGGGWRATIGRKRDHLGYFSCPAAAHFAYIIEANKRYGDYARSSSRGALSHAVK